jgi:hypothetical protein
MVVKTITQKELKALAHKARCLCDRLKRDEQGMFPVSDEKLRKLALEIEASFDEVVSWRIE